MFNRLATAKGQWKPQELWISPLEFDRSLSDFEIACPQSTALYRVCLSASAAQENRNRQIIGTFGARLNWRVATLPFVTARPVSISEGFLRTVFFFFALGGHISVSSLKDRKWSS